MTSRLPLKAMLLALVVLLAPSLASAEEVPPTPPTVLIFGDSITARYNDDPTSLGYGWWARTAYGLKMTPVVNAFSGSGMQVLGPNCKAYGTSFVDRLGLIDETVPDMIIVEGGRNDMFRCKDSRHRPINTKSYAYAGINTYMKALRQHVNTIGLDPSKVYVVTPWGTKEKQWRALIVKYTKALARAQGFHFIDTPMIPATHLNSDRIHPNIRGSRALSNQVLAYVRAHNTP